jgi:hypothetical protein
MADKIIDVNKLATDATSGNGCSILDAFQGQSIQAQLAAIRQLAKVPGLNVTADAYAKEDTGLLPLPDKYMRSPHIGISVEKVKGGWFVSNDKLFTEEIWLGTGTTKGDLGVIEYTCSGFDQQHQAVQKQSSEKF